MACEYSGTVRDAFRALGHDAWSCDLLPSDADPKYHYHGSVLDIILQPWDMVIAHPPCTYLTNAAAKHLSSEEPSTPTCLRGVDRWKAMFEGCIFFRTFQEQYTKYTKHIPKVCIENPIPVKYAREYIGKYTQIVQPWWFGHMETKATCLWLKGLPKLTKTNDVKAEMDKLTKAEKNRLHMLPPSEDRWKIRSKTFQGLADAMAAQWG